MTKNLLCPVDPAHGVAAEYMRSYNRRPEVQARERARRRDPDTAAKRREQARRRRATIEGRARTAVANAIRTSRRWNVPSALTFAEALRVMASACVYCGRHPALGLDHVIPMSRGGPNVIANVVSSCFECNQRKWARALAAFTLDLCPRGHEYATEAATFTYQVGRRAGRVVRYCRSCRNALRRERYALRTAA